MIMADVIRIIAQGGLALALISPIHVQVWHLCLASALYGVGSALYTPAQIGLTPSLVKPEQLKRANALLSSVADVGSLLGPAFAGVLMAMVGFAWVLALDCLSFLANIALLVRLVPLAARARATSDPGDDSDAGDSSFVTGLRLARGFPWFVTGLVLWFLVSLGIGLVAVAGPVMSVDALGGIGAWATLSTCLAAGSLLGSLSAVVAFERLRWAVAAVIVAVSCVVQYVLMAVYQVGPALWLVGAAFLLASFATASCGITWDTEYQHRIPERFLSRLASLESFTNSVGIPLGMLLGGVLAGWYQVLFLVIAGLLALCSVSVVILGRQSSMEVNDG
jgi:MFS family permease